MMEFKQDQKHDGFEYIDGLKVDEDASRFSNGITAVLNDEELDIEVDLHDFDVEFEVLDNMMIIFGKWRPASDVKDCDTPPPKKEGRRYQAFVHPTLLPPNMNIEKIHSEVENGIVHIKIPKDGFLKKLLDAEHCALCKFRKCLCKYIPGLASQLERLEALEVKEGT